MALIPVFSPIDCAIAGVASNAHAAHATTTIFMMMNLSLLPPRCGDSLT